MNHALIAAICIASSAWSPASADGSRINPKTATRQPAAVLHPQAQQSTPSAGRRHAAGPRQLPGTQTLGGGDDCSAADVIVGTGSFAFDTTAATSGPQSSVPCGSCDQDVWFSWTAPSTGMVVFSLCGGANYDSLIAVYDGSGCPSGAAIACNDDSCSLVSSVSFSATAGSNYMLQIGGYSGYTGAGTFSLTLPPPGTNDDCASATPISGLGTFPFNTVGMTTGPQGQGLACGSGACNQDVWFTWSAPASGVCEFSLCNGAGFDSLIAAYAGSGCPSGTALACNDDSCGMQSRITFPVTAGGNYTLQLGAYSNGTGTGTFTLGISQPPPPCGPFDDGTSENLLGWTAGGDMVWLSRFGSAGGSSMVNSIDVAWGSALYPGNSPGDGTATDVFIWVDGASQDGDPNDATLIEQVPTVVSNVDTDTFVSIPIVPRIINGVFFVGTHLAHAAGQYVAPIDQTAHPYANISWFFGDNTSPTSNYTNPGLNLLPPATLESAGIAGQFLVRIGCSSGPATFLCDPGLGSVIACPCANPAAGSGRGCDNSAATGGASLSASGSNSLLSPNLSFSTAGEMPNATTILVQGDAEVSAGATFGQGVRCAGGNLLRMYVHTAVGGSISAPSGFDTDIPGRSMSLGDTLSAGMDRWYMAYYRDPHVLGGCSPFATFNSTNTAKVTWLP